MTADSVPATDLLPKMHWLLPDGIPPELEGAVRALWSVPSVYCFIPGNWQGRGNLFEFCERLPDWPRELTSPAGRQSVRLAIDWLAARRLLVRMWWTTSARHRRPGILLLRTPEVTLSVPPTDIPPRVSLRKNQDEATAEIIRKILKSARKK